ncbi:ParA family protein [Limibacter armeniacum]|uniref:ParA family protein n=1 Tax=Limibacter armeniacum TaxID=466084 RepID=UPI002FE50773
MKTTAVIDFLNGNPALSLSALEKEAGLSKGLLSKVQRGERQLNDKHLLQLKPILVKYGFNQQANNSGKAKVISIINHKGGVAKTTTAINLGKALSLLGKKVLLVDIDAQGNLSQALGIDQPEKQLVNALLDDEPLPIYNISENLDLSPSDLELADADLELVQQIGGFNRLNKVLQPVLNDYDYVLVDCPPALNIITNAALVAADSCLITLQPEISAIKGLDKLLSRVQQVQEEINDKLTVEGVVFTLVKNQLVIHQENMDYVKEALAGFRVFESVIRVNVAITESQSAQQDVFSYQPKSNGADDYMSLAYEVLGVN